MLASMSLRSHGLRLVYRSLHAHTGFSQNVRFLATDRSKVEKTLRLLKDDLQKQADEEKRLNLVSVNIGAAHIVKPSLKERVVHELKHYYHGFRLLALETRVSSKYAVRVLRGATLNRRERQQLVRTVSDLFRLVPFSIFIIVPFMELALPIFIKLFPDMLPSTFQETSKEEEKIRKQLKVRVEMAKFLQNAIEEMALERKTREKTQTDSKALEFAHFIKRVRSEGGYVSNKDIFTFSKLFEDELTLDNLNMGQLRSLCRLMSLQTLGSPEILRFQLNMKLRELKADDKQIAAEGGVDALSSLDLQQACRARGMRALGLSEDRLKDQLKQWLELSLNDKVPPSLLLLSRTLYLPEDISFTDRLKTLVQSLPEGIAEHTRQELTKIEGGKVDHKARLELIREIEEAIAKEAAIEQEHIKLEKLKQKEIEVPKEIPDVVAEPPKILVVDAQPDVPAMMEATAAAKVEAIDNELHPHDLSSIEQVLVGGPLSEAKQDIIDLRERLIEHSEDLVEVNALDGAFSETKVARRLRSKLKTMIEHADSLVNRLEDEKRNVNETLADPAESGSDQRKKEKLVRIHDLIEGLEGLRDGDQSRRARIEQLLKSLDDDRDGFIDGKLVLEVIDLLEKHSNIPVSAAQMASMVEILRKEGQAEEAMTKAIEEAQFDEPMTVQVSETEEYVPATPTVTREEGPLPLPQIDPTVTIPLQVEQEKKTEKSV